MDGCLALWASRLAVLGCLLSPLAQAAPAAVVSVTQQAGRGSLTKPYATLVEASTRGYGAHLKAGCQNCHGTDLSCGPSLPNDRWV